MHQEENKLIQMTLHEHRKIENIHVHINNPKAEAIVIGNDNQVKMETKEVDQIRLKTIEFIERIVGEQVLVYLRKQNDEILKRLEQITRMVRIITYFVCLCTYEFCLSLWKIVRSSVILLLPLLTRN